MAQERFTNVNSNTANFFGGVNGREKTMVGVRCTVTFEMGKSSKFLTTAKRI
jgi:hypothetical protein